MSGLLWSRTGVAVRQVAAKLFRELSDELDGYVYHDEHGCLNLFTPDQWREFQKFLPLYDDLGKAYELLDANDVSARWPRVVPEADSIGILDPTGGYSEPSEYIPALAKRVRELGVDIREGETVREFLTEQNVIRGVRTAANAFSTESVICTVHAWAKPLLSQAGYHVPVKYFVHQRYVTRPVDEAIRLPPINANAVDGYVRPASGNRILIGTSTPERDEFNVESLEFHMSELATPTSVRDEAATRLAALVPALQGAVWESQHIGLLAFSMDQEPILGPVQILPGLFLGTSFHSGGFSYNPAAGMLLAECVVDGETSIDISAFSPNRFTAEDIGAHLATRCRQADMERRRH